MNYDQTNSLMSELQMAFEAVTNARERFIRCRCVPDGANCKHRQALEAAHYRLDAAKTAIREALRSKACPECGRKGGDEVRATTKQLADELVEAVEEECLIDERHKGCPDCEVYDKWVSCQLEDEAYKAGDRVERAIRAIVRALEAKETK